MSLNCLRCMPVEKPEIYVVERRSTAPLCEKCGNQKIDIVERLDFILTDEQLRGYAEHQREVEVAVDKVRAEEGFIKDGTWSEPPLAPSLPEGITVTFEEVDHMNSAELAALANKLGITFKEGEFKQVVVDSLKKVLSSK